MLIISSQLGHFDKENGYKWVRDSTLSGSWHVGETLRVPDGPVITFQADGDELEAIIEYFRASGVNVVWPSARLTPIL